MIHVILHCNLISVETTNGDENSDNEEQKFENIDDCLNLGNADLNNGNTYLINIFFISCEMITEYHNF